MPSIFHLTTGSYCTTYICAGRRSQINLRSISFLTRETLRVSECRERERERKSPSTPIPSFMPHVYLQDVVPGQGVHCWQRFSCEIVQTLNWDFCSVTRTLYPSLFYDWAWYFFLFLLNLSAVVCSSLSRSGPRKLCLQEWASIKAVRYIEDWCMSSLHMKWDWAEFVVLDINWKILKAN